MKRRKVMKLHALLIAGLTSSLLLVGCSGAPVQSTNAQDEVIGPTIQQVKLVEHEVVPQEAEVSKLIKVSGIGFGAESAYENVTRGQRRLMAIRASKLDAYRSLAEQLYGIKIDSNTSVSSLTAKSDSFRARVNAIVRGARVVSVTPLADRNYETVLEVFVDKGFFNNTFVYTNCPNGNCVNNQSTVMDHPGTIGLK